MAVVTSDTSRRGHTLGLLAFALLIIAIDYNIVYVALPEIGADLDFSGQTLQWVVSAYAVAYGGFLLLGGRVADLVGRRRVFVLGLSLYAVFSLLGAVATSPWLLVVARAGQGLGGAFLFPASLSLVNTIFPEGPERNRALSLWAATGAGGMVLGSLLGGVLTHVFGWQAVFYVNVPLAAGAILFAYRLIAPDTASAAGRFDLPGAVTGTVGVTSVVFALVQGPESGWTSTPVVVSAAAGAAILTTFLVLESRNREPLMPLRLFGNRSLAVGTTVAFLFAATFGTLLYFLTVYLQGVHGYSALETGLAFLVPMAAGFVGSVTGGGLTTRFGVRTTMITNLALGAVGAALLAAAMSSDGSYVSLLPGLVLLSVCQGVVYTTMFAAAATGVEAHEQGIASGMVSTGQQVGAAVGLAVLVAAGDNTAEGLRTSVLVTTAGIVLAVLVAMNFQRTPRKAPT